MKSNLMVEKAALLERYRLLRAIMRDLHRELVKTLSKDEVCRGGQKLGFMVDGTLAFEDEDEASLLMDYCLYEGRAEPQNAIRRFMAKQPYRSGSDEMMLLEAMSRARYALLQVESVANGVGANCRDLLRNACGSLVDEGLGNTAQKGVVFACHLVVLSEMSMTTGAVLPIDTDALENIHDALKCGAQGLDQMDFDDLSYQEQAELSAIIIRCALFSDVPSPLSVVEPRRCLSTQLAEPFTPLRPSRNDLCLCGSGRKYKRCCGRAG